jgi:SAM-dependent methyltransferase
MSEAENKWTDFYLTKSRGSYPVWPIEVMVKVLFGDYLKGSRPVFNSETKVLDIGCGLGNNLLPFLVNGCKCFGVEITDEIAQLSQDVLHKKGFKEVVVKKGNNRLLPFDSHEFDLVISNNVLHYEKNEEDYLKALAEYSRVLKKGGALFLMTVGEEHDIYRKAQIVGAHQFKISDWDFRSGEQYFYVSNGKYLKYYLDKFFADVELGQVTEKLMKVNLEFLVAFCRKTDK